MKIDDKNFVQQLKKRNERALDYVIDTYGGLMKSIVKKHLYSLEHIQGECMNDILMAVWIHIDSFNPDRNTFQNWLGGVSRYKCIDYKRKYLNKLETQNIDEITVESSSCVERNIIQNELNEELENLLSNLKKEDQELFFGHYVEEKEVKDLSKEMSIAPSVVYNRLSRGRSKLRNILAGKKV